MESSGESITECDELSIFRVLAKADDGKSLVQFVNSRFSNFTDPLSGKVIGRRDAFIYLVDKNGKLEKLYTIEHEKLNDGTYGGVSKAYRSLTDGRLEIADIGVCDGVNTYEILNRL